ncbi:unnamed protein product, partial [Tuber aestivum]
PNICPSTGSETSTSQDSGETLHSWLLIMRSRLASSARSTRSTVVPAGIFVQANTLPNPQWGCRLRCGPKRRKPLLYGREGRHPDITTQKRQDESKASLRQNQQLQQIHRSSAGKMRVLQKGYGGAMEIAMNAEADLEHMMKL